MRLPPTRDWYAEDLTAAIVEDATPPASTALLVQAALWPEAVALAPYCGTAHCFDAMTASTLETRYLAFVVAPGAAGARAALGCSWDYATTASQPANSLVNHNLVTTASGAGANDVILVPFATTYTTKSVAFAATSGLTLSSDTNDPTPSSSKQRRIEVQTLAAPYVEPCKVIVASSASFAVSAQIDDLETL